MRASVWNRPVAVENPGVPSPAVVSLVERWLAPAVDLCHRPTLEGLEHLPREGPFVLVANHSAGLGIAELLSLAVLYLREVGPSRPLAGFAHPLGFQVPGLSHALRGLGAVPSTYASARQCLDAGVPLLVFPGGDHETLRPLHEAHTVDFAGRVGFLRIAREAGVPIVPLGIRGGHFTAPVLFRANALATLLVLPRAVGLKRWSVSLLALLGAAAIAAKGPRSLPLRGAALWLWLGSPLTFLPWIPWTLRFRLGEPLTPEALFPAGDRTDEELLQALARVESAVQSLVNP